MKMITLLAIALIGLGLTAHFRWGVKASNPSSAIERPNDALVSAVLPITAILKGHAEDGAKLAGFYAALADVVDRDQGRVLKTTHELRELHRRAGLLAFQKSGIEGKYPDLSKAIEKILADEIGLDNVALDAVKQEASQKTFKALAWACAGGDI
jgi:nitrogen fixation-related uncharacterized protein